MLHRGPGVGVALNAETGQQRDLVSDDLAEAVLAIAADGNNHGLINLHIAILPRSTDAISRTPPN